MEYDKEQKIVNLSPKVEVYRSSRYSIRDEANNPCKIQKRLSELNNTIPDEIYSKLEEDTP